jgi:flagellar basal-body rod protein FlgG
MGFLSRAATGLFSLGLVSALLVGGHWITRSSPRPAKPPRSKVVEARAAVFSQMPDFKMPESPPASGPVRGLKLSAILADGGAGDQPLFSAATRAPTVIHATSGQGPGSELAPPKFADASESSVPSRTQPLPLPVRTYAIPLRPEGPELPPVGEPPGSAPKFPSGSSGRRIIDRALPNSSAEEREVWHDALKDFSPKDVRELLRLREELGRMPQSAFDSRIPIAQPHWAPTVPGPIASEPFHPSSDSPGLWPDAGRDAARTIAASLDALTQAQQILLNNVANANTDGFKRVAIAFESVASSPGGGPGSFGVGVRLAPKTLDMSPGKIRHTDRPLDLAIDGEGFFQLEDPRTHQTFYTRYGRFAVNAKGEMVWRTTQRELLLRPSVKIAAPENDVEIATSGAVEAATLTGGSGRQEPQRIVIVRLPALADLVPTGENLFAIRGELPSPGSLASDPLAGRLRQGCLEESNVDVERELRELEGLRRQAHALEAAAQGLSFGSHEIINPAGEQTAPSHVAGSLGADRH